MRLYIQEELEGITSTLNDMFAGRHGSGCSLTMSCNDFAEAHPWLKRVIDPLSDPVVRREIDSVAPRTGYPTAKIERDPSVAIVIGFPVELVRKIPMESTVRRFSFRQSSPDLFEPVFESWSN